MTEGPPGGVSPRRRRNWRDWYIWGLIGGAAAFALGPSLVGARTLISVNFLSYFMPWQAVEGNVAVGHQLCQSDTVDSVMPSIHFIKQQVLSGHLGSWQNLQGGGGPMSALPNTGLLDPLSLPYWILPLRWAPGFVVLLCWAAAIAGTYLFLRRLSVGRPAATVAGFVFATSGFMVMWSNWPQTRTAALVPLLFWAIERVITRARSGDLALLGAIFASMLLGGFPQVTGYALYLGGAYFVVRVLLLHRGPQRLRAAARPAAMAVGGLALGGGLSAVQMLPFLRFYQDSSFGYRQGFSGSGEPFSSLTSVIAPGTNGLCVVPVKGPPATFGGYPIELVAYVGAAALVLALAAAVVRTGRGDENRAVTGFFVVGAVVISALCFGPGWVRTLPDHLPIFNNTVIDRIRSVMGFAFAVLAGFGFDRLTAGGGEAGERRFRLVPWSGVIALGAAVVGLFAIRDSHRAAFRGGYLGTWTHAATPAFVLLAISLAAALVAGLVRRGTAAGWANRAAFVVLPVLVVAQGTQFFHTVMPGDSPSSFYPDTPDHQFLEAHVGPDRVASANLTLYPSTGFYYGLRFPTGHQFNDGAWNQLLTSVYKGVMLTPTSSDFGGDISPSTIGRQPILDQMAVKYFAFPPTELDGSVAPLPPAPGSASTAGGPVTCRVPGGPIRGVEVKLAAPLSGSVAHTGPTVDVTVSSGTTTIRSGIYTGSALAPGQVIEIPVAGEDLPLDSPTLVSLSASNAAQPLVLAAAGGGEAVCSPIQPVDDGLKLVFAYPGAVIYQRQSSLPRIRWDSDTVVRTTPQTQLAAMEAGLAANTVLLAAPGPPGSGLPASIQILSDGDRISAEVRAAGSGYLVVGDAMQVPGWSVAVDGRPARMVPADYSMVAVAVPAGTHKVTFTYTAPGEEAGALITGLALLIAAGCVWWDVSRRRSKYLA
jgi:hypothetical protein